MQLASRGLARVFVDLTSHSEVEGELARSAARPEAYRADVRRNGAERHYSLDYGRDGSVKSASAPAPTGPQLVVAADQIRGTVDQLTAYFLIERQLAHAGSCLMVVPVFDFAGFDYLRFSYLKRDTLSDDSSQKFAGRATVC